MPISIPINGPAAELYAKLPEPERARVVAAAERLIMRRAKKASSTPQSEVMGKRDLMGGFLEALPSLTFTTGMPDFSQEHDHYIYGADKKNSG
ncbi:MAG: hypothetical protein JWQ90_954 [Hydrocarboniphaga sp.]|uniref:hypothetical protein n=1 Tax=Hydrocarboniphaga sp. TaxID=2033016 RepID=UPI00261CF8D2|nr:hypothetical protein [Hydrocarboniphaga sp.]MDB5968504.1 hypothetical protein [Hydrocarboniphaga sp.]